MSNGTAPAPPKHGLLVGPGFFFDNDDSLQLTAWNSLASVALTMSGRFVRPDGSVEPFVERHVPNTNRTASTAIFARGCGWLTDLSIVASGATPQRGQTFARVDVVRGQSTPVIVLSTIAQGYATATKRLAYPGSVIEDSLSGAGALRSITGTDPAANVEISETVPTGARWRLRSLRAALVSDANPANREVALQIDDGTNVYFEASSGANQAASLTRQYTFAQTAVRGAAATGTGILVAIGDLMLAAGHRITTLTTNRQATDNWGAPQYLVEELLEAL